MNFQIVEKSLYKKAYKKLLKQYKHIENDMDNFFNSITSKNDLGIEIKSNIFKARIKNSDKNRGKSAGYRLISYLAIVDNEVHLLYIYDKSKIENLTENEIDKLIIQQINFN
jgi:mRNA-degrading endonuclease RelE of RelBE toxin-antitoxin system